MTEVLKKYAPQGLIGLFIIANAILTSLEVYWLNLLPVVLVIFFLAFLRLDILFFICVALTPLSINLEELQFGLGLALPTEPLIFGIMLLFIFKLIYERSNYGIIFNHPISLAIAFHLLWILITTLTSTMPVVSLKFLISRCWFVFTFYYLGILLFREQANVVRFFWAYLIPLCGVIIYTVINHATYGFEEEPAHWVMDPFYKDHTSYGAIIAMYIPVLLLLAFSPFYSKMKGLAAAFLVVFIIGIIFSYTRAAWISLVGALGLFLIYKLRIRLWMILSTASVVTGFFFIFRQDIIMSLEKNRQDSSTNLTEHVQSISNISSDASNLERINRWQSAFRMFGEKPFFGWGPGTYTFKYAPFQLSSEKTIISTNAGDLGNAHSEYIGPLAEQGVLGAIAFICIVVVAITVASRLYSTLQDRKSKVLVLTSIVALSTYFIHAALNNFLDTDKASVPFWGFLAILTAIDLKSKEEERNKSVDLTSQ